MFNFYFNKVKQVYELTEMVRMFLPKSQYRILEDDLLQTETNQMESLEGILIKIPDSITTRDNGKRYIYDILKKHTGKSLDWGILTGVRPVKLTGEILASGKTEKETEEILRDYYYLNREKAELLLSVRNTQMPYLKNMPDNSVAVYVGIPFCPTKCVYCSFPSYQENYDKIQNYLRALIEEIKFVGSYAKKKGMHVESIYIGGGTPTVLEDNELEVLLKTVGNHIDTSFIREFTLEAGRPDTITESKLNILKENGVDRISINPQSMNQNTLSKIGRFHGPEDIVRAFEIAKRTGFRVVNADLIAGLPDEEPEDFKRSLESLIQLSPENITIHTLAIKRASKLKEIDGDYNYRQGDKVNQMLKQGSDRLKEIGYRPYYLYRQKQMAGNLENVGYGLPGTESIYNIRIMEENQTILAMGAGGISKVWFPESNRLERVPNVSNYEIYIERIDDMIDRKRKGIFNI